MQAGPETEVVITSSDPALEKMMDRFVNAINPGNCGFRLRLWPTGMEEEGPVIDTRDYEVAMEKMENEPVILFSPFKGTD
jgi:hypothetical protein